MSKLTGQQIADEGLDGWAYLLGGLQTRILTKNFAAGLSVVNAIGAAAEQMSHHPDLDLRYTHVDVRSMRGSMASLMPSPTRLKASVVSSRVAAGKPRYQ